MLSQALEQGAGAESSSQDWNWLSYGALVSQVVALSGMSQHQAQFLLVLPLKATDLGRLLTFLAD